MKPIDLMLFMGVEAIMVGIAVVVCFLLYGNPLDLEKTWMVWVAAFFSASVVQMILLTLVRSKR